MIETALPTIFHKEKIAITIILSIVEVLRRAEIMNNNNYKMY